MYFRDSGDEVELDISYSLVQNNQDGVDDNDNGDNGNYRVIVPPKQFLSYNIISPACCQYTQDYTSSTGCVCLTPQQRQLLRFRYGNRS